jgi:hypothetical protein
LEEIMHKLLFIILTASLVLTPAAADDGFKLSGVLDSTVMGAADADGLFVYGLEEYANLRLQTRVGQAAAFYGAFNVLAAAGLPAAAVDALGGFAGGNYAAAIDVERLYLRLSAEAADFDVGLQRLAFGYGASFSPSDFLAARSPLFPDARPRGVLGLLLSAYPADYADVRVFAAAPKDALASGGEGFLLGAAGDWHGGAASIQAIYAYQTPIDGVPNAPAGTAAPNGLHRVGLSAKADVEAGITVDALYTAGYTGVSFADGLAASAGIDYSFFAGRLYLAAEYLYCGPNSASSYDSGANPYGFLHRHYLFGTAMYRFDDFTALTLALMCGLDDASFLPILSFDTDLAQGLALAVTLQVPAGKSGAEFAPSALGRVRVQTRLRVKY